MEEIKAPKKERKFLKAIGNIGKVLVKELVMGIARKFIGKAIDKVGNKKQGLVIAFLLMAGISYASIDSIPYPVTGNKQRLGWQTTGNGLVWRGRATDTITKPTSYADKNVKAYLILDSVSGSLYVFKQGSWAAISGAGGGLTMPFDSITFNTAKDGTVGVGEVEYNDTQGSLIQGLKGGNVTNVIGQQLHQRVNNRTGAILAKGTAVYLSGSQGNRITVAKALGVTDAFSANTFGIVAESIANNQSGYIITEGLITGINTSALVEDSAVYLSPTVAGGLTSTKPQAPQHTVYIGVCVKSNAGSGELFVKIRNGQELDELHDVRISSPINNASLYYKSSEGIWRDTTAALLVSDTATMLSNYPTKAYIDTSGRFYARQDFLNVSSPTLTWTQEDKLITGNEEILQIYRNGQILLPNQYTVTNDSTLIISATSYKLGENYTVLFPRGGGGLGTVVSVTPSTTAGNPISITNTTTTPVIELLSATSSRNGYLTSTDWTTFNNKLNISDTASMLTNYLRSGVAASTYQTKLTNPITGIGSSLYLPIFGSSSYISPSLLRWDGITVPNAKLINEYNFNEITAFAGTGTRMVVASSTGLLSTQTIGASVSTFSAGTTGFTPSTATSGAVTLGGTLAITNGGTGANSASTARTALGATVRGSNVFTLPDIDQVSFIRYNANNTVSQRTAEGIRLDLGGTTLGQNMFMLTNPSAITFPRFNADNTVSALSAADFRTAIGVGAGGGTVTSVSAGSPANGLSVANGTTTPVISIALAGSSTIGVVSATTQTFGGAKTFANIVGFQRSIQRPVESVTVSSASITTSSTWVVVNNAGTVTLTFPAASSSTGTEFHIKTITNNAVVSQSSNIVPLAGGSASTSILSATAGKWATLVSDGTNWIIMQAN